MASLNCFVATEKMGLLWAAADPNCQRPYGAEKVTYWPCYHRKRQNRFLVFYEVWLIFCTVSLYFIGANHEFQEKGQTYRLNHSTFSVAEWVMSRAVMLHCTWVWQARVQIPGRTWSTKPSILQGSVYWYIVGDHCWGLRSISMWLYNCWCVDYAAGRCKLLHVGSISPHGHP